MQRKEPRCAGAQVSVPRTAARTNCESGASARRAAPRRELPPCASRGGRSSYNVRSITAIGAVAGGDRPEMQVPEKSQASIGTPKGVTLRGLTDIAFRGTIWRRASFAHVPAAAVSDVARPCGLDGHLHTRHAQVPVLVRSRTRVALERERYMRPKLLVNALASETRSWPTRTLTWLLLRALPLKERATVVDTVPIPTLSPPRAARSARATRYCASSSSAFKTKRRPARVSQRWHVRS